MPSIVLVITWALAAFRTLAILNVPNRPTNTTSLMQKTNSLPFSFVWISSDVLVGPKNDGRRIAAIKDPSIVFYNGRYHVFASTARSSGYNLVYFSFTNFEKAGESTFYYLDQTPIGSDYRAAPQIFYFAPQKLWYLIFQVGDNAAYSTNKDISNPAGWSAPKGFYSGTPRIITQNIGNGFWVDMWVICDSSTCHLFSSDENGHLYRSQTPLNKFPNGMSEPVIALSGPRNAVFQASNVYSLDDGDYLLLVEAIGGDGAQYFRSWTASSISGPWISLADSESNPFARSNNVAFIGNVWTNRISHGEMVRAGFDQTMTISPCNLRYFYQGVSPSAGGDYNSLPWKLGLLTQINSAC